MEGTLSGMRAARGLPALGACVALAALAGCASSERDQVQAKVKQFAQATASRDSKTLCEQVLAPSLLARMKAGGITCQKAMQIFVSSVENPTVSIGRIFVNGQTASAITLTSAQGQAGSLDTIQLVKTSHGWRVASLAAPALPAGASASPTATQTTPQPPRSAGKPFG